MLKRKNGKIIMTVGGVILKRQWRKPEMKKIISCIVCLVILAGNMQSVNAVDNTDDNKISLLNSISSINVEIKDSEQITRGEFVSLVTQFYFGELYKGSFNVTNNFSDVSYEYPYKDEIAFLKSMGVINGDQYGNFYPDMVIKYQDAAKILICALGYEVYAVSKGGYPIGYITACNEFGINKNVKSFDIVSYSDATNMIYNSLFSDVWGISSIGSNGANYEFDTQKDVLLDRFNISVYDAVLTDNSISSIDNTLVGEDKVVFKDYKTSQKYIMGYTDSGIKTMLGVRLKVFARYDAARDENVVVHYAPVSQVTITKINSKNIIDSNENYIEYETDKNSSRTYKINIEDSGAFVFVNGYKVSDYTGGTFIPENGFVEFIDNNGNNKADFIKVTDFKCNIVVDRVSEEDGFIMSKFNPLDNINIDDDVVVIIYDGEKEIPISDLKENEIISVAVSSKTIDGKTLYMGYVSRDFKTEKINSYSEDTFTVYFNDETEADFSSFYLSKYPDIFLRLSLDSEYTVRFDVTGEIAYIDSLSGKSDNFCYLINMDEQKTSELKTVVKIYEQSGMFKIYALSSKVKIDGQTLDGRKINGESASQFEEARELLSLRNDGKIYSYSASYAQELNKTYTTIIPRPAIVKLNKDDEIISIDTDTVSYSGDKSLDTLAFHTRVPRDSIFRNAYSTYDSSFFITSDTVILKVPDIDRYGLDPTYSTVNINVFEEDLNDISNYGVYTVSELSAFSCADISVYNVDENTGIARYAIVMGRMAVGYSSVNYSGQKSVFESLTTYYDENLEKIVYKVNFNTNGVKDFVLVDRDHIAPWYENIIFGGKHYFGSGNADYKEVEPLENGDIIFVQKSGNYLKHLERVLNISNMHNKVTTVMKPEFPNKPYSASSYSITDVGVPYDERNYVTKRYANSNMAELSIPIRASAENKIFVRVPEGYTVGEYISNDGDVSTWDKYIDLTDVRITLIEKNGEENGKPVYKISQGGIEDIKFEDFFADNKSANASKLFGICSYAKYYDLFIINE